MDLFDQRLQVELKTGGCSLSDKESCEWAYDRAIAYIMQPWALGWHDRGLGHGDYGVILADTRELVIPSVPQEIAQHLIDLHNQSLSHSQKKTKGAKHGRSKKREQSSPDETSGISELPGGSCDDPTSGARSQGTAE